MPNRPAPRPQPAAATLEGLALELERYNGRQNAHEQVCEERGRATDAKLDTLDGKVDALTKSVETVSTQLSQLSTAAATAAGVAKGMADARKPKWWVGPVVALAIFFLGAVLTAFGWMASRIVSDNDARIAAALRQPPAATSTVTVNPAPPAAMSPVTPTP